MIPKTMNSYISIIDGHKLLSISGHNSTVYELHGQKLITKSDKGWFKECNSFDYTKKNINQAVILSVNFLSRYPRSWTHQKFVPSIWSICLSLDKKIIQSTKSMVTMQTQIFHPDFTIIMIDPLSFIQFHPNISFSVSTKSTPSNCSEKQIICDHQNIISTPCKNGTLIALEILVA